MADLNTSTKQDDAFMPHVVFCKNCQKILSDSTFFLGEISSSGDIVFSGVQNVEWDSSNILLSQEETDYLSTYHDLKCASCKESIGRMYCSISDVEAFNFALGKFTLRPSCVDVYHLGKGLPPSSRPPTVTVHSIADQVQSALASFAERQTKAEQRIRMLEHTCTRLLAAATGGGGGPQHQHPLPSPIPLSSAPRPPQMLHLTPAGGEGSPGGGTDTTPLPPLSVPLTGHMYDLSSQTPSRQMGQNGSLLFDTPPNRENHQNSILLLDTSLQNPPLDTSMNMSMNMAMGGVGFTPTRPSPNNGNGSGSGSSVATPRPKRPLSTDIQQQQEGSASKMPTRERS